MTTSILSPKWRGERSEPIDPDAIRFTAQESPSMAAGDECKGCLFDGQRHAVCELANKKAVAMELPDCMDVSPSGHDYIYVLDTSDPRQIDLLKEAP